jgi:hypothetical protein
VIRPIASCAGKEPVSAELTKTRARFPPPY